MSIFKDVFHRIGKAIIKCCQTVNFVQVEVAQIQKGDLLHDRKIVITGGSKGIGYAMAKKFVSEGATVIITGRNEESLKEACSNLGKPSQYIVFDSNNIKDLSDFIIECESRFNGSITDLVCNAGISLHESNILSVTEEGFDSQFNTNLRSVYFLCQSFLKSHLEEANTGSNILIISSETGDMGYDIPYGMTKAGLNSLTRALARRYYSKNIRVNAIAPGVTLSEMTQYAKSEDGNMSRKCAAGRVFLPEEVAEVACFLLSDAAKCISGEIIHTNAGNHIRTFWD